MNKINISSFNFSTSPQAIKHYILLVGPRFYQPRATGLAEMSNPAVGRRGGRVICLLLYIELYGFQILEH